MNLPGGARVRVTHFRNYGRSGVMTKYEAMLIKITDPPLAKGGQTVVWIEFAGGTKAYGSAKCSLIDNYDRRKGFTIALGRAMKSARKRGVLV